MIVLHLLTKYKQKKPMGLYSAAKKYLYFTVIYYFSIYNNEVIFAYLLSLDR